MKEQRAETTKSTRRHRLVEYSFLLYYGDSVTYTKGQEKKNGVILIWWQMLMPSVTIALGIRLLAVFGPKYFSWIELLSVVQGESQETRVERRKAIGQRTAVPVVIVAVWTLIIPDIHWLDGAFIGAVAAGLLLWPMVFHGLPHGVYKNDWLLAPVYGSFVLILTLSASLGNLAVNPLPGVAGFSYVISTIAAGLLLTALLAIAVWVFDVSAAALGRHIDDRMSG